MPNLGSYTLIECDNIICGKQVKFKLPTRSSAPLDTAYMKGFLDVMGWTYGPDVDTGMECYLCEKCSGGDEEKANAA